MESEQNTSSVNTYEEVELTQKKQAWAQLIAKVCEVDSLVCPKCGYDMKVVAVIENPDDRSQISESLSAWRLEFSPQTAVFLALSVELAFDSSIVIPAIVYSRP